MFGYQHDGLLQKINLLDLERIKIKLMDKINGKEWSQERAEDAERWYKCFMLLWAKYPNAKIVPTADIDEFWHCHILDTRQYARDCENLFGRFIHHQPSFGPGNEEQIAEHRKNVSLTKELFQREFGIAPTQYSAKCSCSQVGPACF
jgi:hypothetical protein